MDPLTEQLQDTSPNFNEPHYLITEASSYCWPLDAFGDLWEQLGEPLVYLAHLIVAAKGLVLPDASLMRESMAVNSFCIKWSSVVTGQRMVRPGTAILGKLHWSVVFCRRASRKISKAAPKFSKRCTVLRRRD